MLLVNLSGRGDKDVEQVARILAEKHGKGKVGMTRIEEKFQELQKRGRAHLLPHRGRSESLRDRGAGAPGGGGGADLGIELGFPFS